MTKHAAKHGRHSVRPGFAGLAALVLCAVLLFLPTRPVQAAEWMQPYLEQVREWGVMYGDSSGNLHEDRPITRAELVVMMNRAFGYTEPGPNPFSDVSPSDWYAEDICIAHQAGYFNGTSPTTAAPRAYVTREQAAALLGRCLRLQGTSGATTSFYDGNTISPSFRGLVQEAADLGIIQGYADGNFRPKARITRGQVACFLVRALGTLVQEPGEQISGGVYGNLTINRPGVKLKDTVITGNLYLTGGVGLGNVELENVTVMGKIVLCGGGTSEKGQNSVVLRNVTAEAMEVDSLAGQFLSVRAEGLTDIGTTTVRTSSYLEDVTENGLGLQLIHLDGDNGVRMQLAGNIKEVVNLTPGSTLQVAQGVADVVTMDERAVGATLDVANMASIRTLNLDGGVPVTGTGSVSHMNINADGSTTSMLPDIVEVRPGVTANVNGQVMDTVGAAESSEDPRLLAGYPSMRNVASTTADAVFRTNKPGTVYWALTALIDGSVGEDALIAPSTNARIIRSGTLNVTASNTDVTARQTNLTRDGSYYISAMLVDNRGRRSPVKTVAFTTPDDTTPNFANGYPYTILTEGKEGEQVIQAMVMPTKDCQLYYVLLPNNAAAPTTADLRAGAVSGNLGFGVIDVKKNVPHLIPRVNSSYLEEQTTYSLYLWLNDADNNKSSAIRRLDVTTLDKTPPTIVHITDGTMSDTSASFTFALDEPGTLYWAVVKQGQTFYARVPDGTENGRIPAPEELIAKIQIENGTNALRSGRVNAAVGGTSYPFTVTGLEGQTRYDLYYVAKDRAGNYNVYTKALTPPKNFGTQDNIGPTVSQEFSHDGTDEGQQTPTPYPDTDIRLVFSETVQGLKYLNAQPDPRNFLNLYRTVASSSGAAKEAAKEALGTALHRHIKLYYRPASGQPTEVNVRYSEGVNDDNWVIDFREAVVELDPEGTGEMIITFPAGTGIKLGSGMTYYFALEDITDISPKANLLQGGNRGTVTLPQFTTIDAQLVFSKGSASGSVIKKGETTPQDMNFHMNFRLSPVTTQNVSNETLWDMIFWSSRAMEFELYSREIGDRTWQQLGTASFNPSSRYPTAGVSISREMLTEGDKSNPNFERLNLFDVDREYGIYVTKLDGLENPQEWTGTGSITIAPVSGDEGSLRTLVGGVLTPEAFEEFQKTVNAVNEIGVPTRYTVNYPFRDSLPPTFIEGQPTFEPGDTGVMMNIQLSRSGHYYYVVAPAGQVPTTITTSSGQTVEVTSTQGWDSLPKNGIPFDRKNNPNATRPSTTTISNPTFSGANYRIGDDDTTGEWTQIPVSGLQPNTDYVAYFVLEGQSATSNVYAFGFHTEVISRPILRARIQNPTATVQSLAEDSNSSSTPKDAVVSYMVINSLAMGSDLNRTLGSVWDDTYAKAAGLSQSQIDTAKTAHAGKTLAEAMATPYVVGSRNVGSVFDLFANPSFQDSLGASFETAQTNGTTIIKVGIQSEELNVNSRTDGRSTPWSSTISCATELRGKSGKYWFVAVGRSPMGSTYAFTAAQYLSDPNIQHPMVTSLNFEFDRSQSPVRPSMGEAMNQPYSGWVTVGFDNPLFFVDNGVKKQVVDTSSDSIGLTGNYVSSSVTCTLPGNIELRPMYSDNTFRPCQSLRFYVSNAYQGAAITFDQFLANENGDYGTDGLVLKLDIQALAPGQYGAVFTIDTAGWDGR